MYRVQSGQHKIIQWCGLTMKVLICMANIREKFQEIMTNKKNNQNDLFEIFLLIVEKLGDYLRTKHDQFRI